MEDLKLSARGDGFFDLSFENGDLALGSALESSVILSIGSFGRSEGRKFTKALRDDGWWGEPTIEGDTWGSLVHTLYGKPNNPNRELLAKRYAESSLRWLKEDGVVDSVDVDSDISAGVLEVDVTLKKAGKESGYRFDFLWSD